MSDPRPPKDQTERLLEFLYSPMIRDNPYAYVMYAFPWGVPNTPLANLKGPREWQKRELIAVADFIKENKKRISAGEDPKTYKCAISSGRGPGKSTLVAWLALWQMSCHMGGSVIVTANTDSQLTAKTFGEIGKWLTMAVNGYWFDRTQKSIVPLPWFATAVKKQMMIDSQYWYIRGELWNEDNPDAFAGAHNTIAEMIIFDEASGIPAPIWTISEGVFTEPTPYQFFFAFSNPRSNTGPFYDCFHTNSKFWRTVKLDARTVEGIPQGSYKETIEKYGIDSRDARVEVLGEFPEQGDFQFIGRGSLADACARELSNHDDYAALCLGVDVARFGDDSTVFFFRQGRDARSIPPIIVRNQDTMAIANKCAELINKYDPDGIFIDSGGGGAGVIDRLKEMGYRKIHEVQFGSKAEDDIYYDHRTELYGRLKEWLYGAMLDGDSKEGKRLVEELAAPEKEYLGRDMKLKLESKDKMKARLPKLGSPDIADALATTFHCHVSRLDRKASGATHVNSARIAKGVGRDVSFNGYAPSGTARTAKGVGSDVNFD